MIKNFLGSEFLKINIFEIEFVQVHIFLKFHDQNFSGLKIKGEK